MSKKGYTTRLITDKTGADIFKGKDIFDEILTINFEKYVNADPNLFWSAGKIVAIHLTKEPFIHIDFDVFISKPLKSFKCFLTQSIEIISDRFGFYREPAIELEKKTKPQFYPPFMKAHYPFGYNCGVLGCIDIIASQAWSKSILSWINHGFNHSIKQGLFYAIVIEQLSLTCFANHYGYPIQTVFTEQDRNLPEITAAGYTHLLAGTKREIVNVEKVRNRLNKELNDDR